MAGAIEVDASEAEKDGQKAKERLFSTKGGGGKSLFDIGNDIKIGSRPDRKCTPFPYSDRREFGNFSFSLSTSHRVMEISCPSSLYQQFYLQSYIRSR